MHAGFLARAPRASNEETPEAERQEHRRRTFPILEFARKCIDDASGGQEAPRVELLLEEAALEAREYRVMLATEESAIHAPCTDAHFDIETPRNVK